MTDPLPGDYATVRTNGIAAAGIRWATGSPVNHAFVYIGGGRIIEARPSGACISPLTAYDGHALHWSRDGLADWQRHVIVERAHLMLGLPYGWLDIAAIGAHRLGLDWAWVLGRLSSDWSVVCSQLVDRAYRPAGVDLTGKPSWEVTPGDLYDHTLGLPVPKFR